jgi:hypothetical protein
MAITKADNISMRGNKGLILGEADLSIFKIPPYYLTGLRPVYSGVYFETASLTVAAQFSSHITVIIEAVEAVTASTAVRSASVGGGNQCP